MFLTDLQTGLPLLCVWYCNEVCLFQHGVVVVVVVGLTHTWRRTMSAAGLALLFGCGERCSSSLAASSHHTDWLFVPAAFCLPAPEHLSMQSVNFRHNLSWNPGAGTPRRTSYVIYDASR